ncbi:MAG: hypothetical protein LUG91_09635, partial [Ruminococcus sp.]|nr:hypothetical protein [Ruminococcus sp.]
TICSVRNGHKFGIYNGKVYIPFFSTIHAIIKNIANKFGVPQIFDEATVSSNINMESLLYTITLEHDKGRCNSNATLKNSDTWKTIVITSSENPLLSETRMHNKGLDARLLSFSLKFTNDRVHSDQIHEFCGKNYGILGKALSEYLLGVDSENIVKIYEEYRCINFDPIFMQNEHKISASFVDCFCDIYRLTFRKT